MLQLKSLGEIASADAGWLRARHHFAIGPYGNAAHKPVGNLIVLNDDEIAPHTGFELHHHANVEIVSYIHDGTLTHHDDQGNVGTVRAGDVQVMSAGTGISHSERNEDDSPVRMFQIWLTPNVSRGAPTWGHRPWRVAVEGSRGLAVSGNPRVGIEFDIASGDRDRSSPNLGTFNSFFQSGTYSGRAALLGPDNTIRLEPTLTLAPRRGVSLSTGWGFFWRESGQDGLYGIAGNLIVPSNGFRGTTKGVAR